MHWFLQPLITDKVVLRKTGESCEDVSVMERITMEMDEFSSGVSYGYFYDDLWFQIIFCRYVGRGLLLCNRGDGTLAPPVSDGLGMKPSAGGRGQHWET